MPFQTFNVLLYESPPKKKGVFSHDSMDSLQKRKRGVVPFLGGPKTI